jgi:hypothetical protein
MPGASSLQRRATANTPAAGSSMWSDRNSSASRCYLRLRGSVPEWPS